MDRVTDCDCTLKEGGGDGGPGTVKFDSPPASTDLYSLNLMRALYWCLLGDPASLFAQTRSPLTEKFALRLPRKLIIQTLPIFDNTTFYPLERTSLAF